MNRGRIAVYGGSVHCSTVHYTVRAFANIFPNIFAKKKGVVATWLVMTIYWMRHGLAKFRETTMATSKDTIYEVYILLPFFVITPAILFINKKE